MNLNFLSESVSEAGIASKACNGMLPAAMHGTEQQAGMYQKSCLTEVPQMPGHVLPVLSLHMTGCPRTDEFSTKNDFEIEVFRRKKSTTAGFSQGFYLKCAPLERTGCQGVLWIRCNLHTAYPWPRRVQLLGRPQVWKRHLIMPLIRTPLTTQWPYCTGHRTKCDAGWSGKSTVSSLLECKVKQHPVSSLKV